MSELRFSLPADVLEEVASLVAGRVLDELGQRQEAGEPWRLLDVEEIAGRLGRSPRWVKERVKTAGLPVVRLDGGALAFDLEAVREWALSRQVPPPELLAGRLQASRDAAPRGRLGGRRRTRKPEAETR